MHRRHELGSLGDVRNQKVRMSNLIVRNLSTFLRLLKEAGRLFWVVLEQPSSSWLWRIEWIMSIGLLLGCVKISTWFLAPLFFFLCLCACVFVVYYYFFIFINHY